MPRVIFPNKISIPVQFSKNTVYIIHFTVMFYNYLYIPEYETSTNSGFSHYKILQGVLWTAVIFLIRHSRPKVVRIIVWKYLWHKDIHSIWICYRVAEIYHKSLEHICNLFSREFLCWCNTCLTYNRIAFCVTIRALMEIMCAG